MPAPVWKAWDIYRAGGRKPEGYNFSTFKMRYHAGRDRRAAGGYSAKRNQAFYIQWGYSRRDHANHPEAAQEVIDAEENPREVGGWVERMMRKRGAKRSGAEFTFEPHGWQGGTYSPPEDYAKQMKQVKKPKPDSRFKEFGP